MTYLPLTAAEMELIAHDEGVRYFVYDDATGHPVSTGYKLIGNPTIGIGRNLAADGITAVEVSALLSDDWLKCVGAASTYDWFASLDKVRAYVVCNMIFNMGPAAFSGFRLLHSFLATGNWTGAANAMLDSRWAKQVPVRAAELEAMMLSGVFPDHAG